MSQFIMQKLLIPMALVILAWIPAMAESGVPGMMDLAAWKGTDVVSLGGTWVLWWEGDPRCAERPIKVPARLSTGTGSDYGFAVYRLGISLPAGIMQKLEGGLALYMPPINSSCLVRWNGAEIWKQGVASADPSLAVPHRLAGVILLQPIPGRNLLEIEVSNYGDIIAGFTEAPALGSLRAIRAALVNYNTDRARIGYEPLRIGVGLHWGSLMLGTIGENQRMDSTVISDTVNTASRLEGLTKKYGRDILVSGETLAALGIDHGFEFENLGEDQVRGRSKPVTVYALR
ncbi:MAG: adenylate/guanylate cyclase domain-containing protein [Spirochaetota bacterium]